MGGPTQLDRESDSPYAEILNRIKFGTEGVGFAGANWWYRYGCFTIKKSNRNW